MTVRSPINRATFDEGTLRSYWAALRALHAPLGVTELVAIHPDRSIYNGYFTSADAMVDAVRPIAGKAAIHHSLNPVRAHLFDTAPNEIRTLTRIPRVDDVAAITAVCVRVQVDTPGRRQSAARTGASHVPLTRRERRDANALARYLFREVSGGWVLESNDVDLLVPVLATGDIRSWAWSHWRPFLRHLASAFQSRPGAGVHVDVNAFDPRCLVPMPGTASTTGTDTRTRRNERVTFEPFGKPDVATNTAIVEAHTGSGQGMQTVGDCGMEEVDLAAVTGLCPGHMALLTGSEGFPLAGSAAEPGSVAAILREAGYMRDSIVDLVALHDRRHRGLLTQRYDAAFVIEQGIETATVPECMNVIEAIGGHADVCLNCSVYRGRRGRFPLRPSGLAPASGMPLSLARELIVDRVRDYLEEK